MSILRSTQEKAYVAPLFKHMAILNRCDVNKLKIACFVYKSTPVVLKILSEINSAVHGYNQHNNCNFKIK